MSKIILTLALIIASQITIAQDFFGKADAFFSQNVKNGLVNYEGLVDNPDLMDDLVKMVANTDLGSMKDQEKKAFLINAYNISTIKLIVDNWPLDNPLNLDGFFDREKHNIAGERMTLNHLENEVLRPTYNDARLHFVLVCGALSCPKIAAFAYMPETLEAKLDERTKLALNDENFIQVLTDKKVVKVSEIFFWYREDFKMKGHTYITYINQFRTNAIPEDFVVDKYTYDWSVNKQ